MIANSSPVAIITLVPGKLNLPGAPFVQRA
jgi:hypothetical protein